MSRSFFCFVAALFLSTLCFSQNNKCTSFELVNSFQASRVIGKQNSNTLFVGFTMAPGLDLSKRWTISTPIKANLYTESTIPQGVSQDLMVGISATFKNGSVDFDASHLFGLLSSDINQMETSLSIMFNRGEADRSSFYKLGISYLTPYDRNYKGSFCVFAGLGLRLSNRR